MSLRVKKNFDLKKNLAVIYRGDYRAFLKPAGTMIVNDIIRNIKHQKTPSGTPLKKNAQSTLKLKRMLGKGQLSLIWDRVLISKGTWITKATKKKVSIFIASVRSKIARSLQKQGYDFFGISVLVRKLIMDRWRKFIKRGLK